MASFRSQSHSKIFSSLMWVMKDGYYLCNVYICLNVQHSPSNCAKIKEIIVSAISNVNKLCTTRKILFNEAVPKCS